jgi:hypothetical protein
VGSVNVKYGVGSWWLENRGRAKFFGSKRVLLGDALLCACLPSLPGVSLDGAMYAGTSNLNWLVCLVSFGVLGRGRGDC